MTYDYIYIAHIPQVQPPELSIFSDNDFLENHIDALPQFWARVIFLDNYSISFSKDVLTWLNHI
jgi:hypothetical protein